MINLLVSVLITARNKARYMADCIDSIRASTYKDLEIVVFDNHSIDNTVNIAEQKNVKVVTVMEQGIPAIYNMGFKILKGKYVFVVNADSKVSENFIARAIDILERDKNIGIVCGYRKQAHTQNLIGCLYQARFNRTNKVGLVKSASGNYIIRKDLYVKFIGAINKKLVSGEESFVSNLILSNNYKIIRLPECSMIHLDDKGNFKTYLKTHLWYAKGSAFAATQNILNLDCYVSIVFLGLVIAGFFYPKFSLIFCVLFSLAIFNKMYRSGRKTLNILNSIWIGLIETTLSILRFLVIPFYFVGDLNE